MDICAHWFTKVKKQSKAMKNIVLDLIYIILNYFVCYVPCWHFRKLCYQLLGMKIGQGSRILMGTTIIKPWKIKIGKNSIINEKCHLDARGGIIIHNNVSISIYTVLITGSHNAQSPTFEFLEMPIHIEDNVWIGAHSILLPGSYLKTSCLIGAGSTVRKGEYQIDGFYSGVPATYVKQRNLKGLYQQQWNPWFR